MEPVLLILAVVIAIAYTVQTATGFGAAVLTLAAGAFLMPIPELVALMVPLSLAQTSWVVARNHRSVDLRYLLLWVTPLMGGATALSFWLLSDLSNDQLKSALGVMILALSAWELLGMWRAAPERGRSVKVEVAALLGAGVVHGVFATGGPLLVYAISRRGMDKRTLRGTLTAAWIPLNVILMVQLLAAGRITEATLADTALLMLGLPVGIWLGEKLHRRVDERRFRVMVFTVMALAGIPMVLS